MMIKLRDIPKGIGLKEYMLGTLPSVVPRFNSELFEYALRTGNFIILLDVFDEVDFAKRQELATQIANLTYSYGDNCVVVSSRPDNILSAWQEFYVADMQGLTKTQAISLIKKFALMRRLRKNFLG